MPLRGVQEKLKGYGKVELVGKLTRLVPFFFTNHKVYKIDDASQMWVNFG